MTLFARLARVGFVMTFNVPGNKAKVCGEFKKLAVTAENAVSHSPLDSGEIQAPVVTDKLYGQLKHSGPKHRVEVKKPFLNTANTQKLCGEYRKPLVDTYYL